MAKFEITSPTGERFEITAPDNASEADVMSYAQAQFSPKQSAPETPKQGMGAKLFGSIAGAAFPELKTAVEAAQTPEIAGPVSNLLSMPQRGIRGLGTAAVSGIQRGAEAVDPSFQPKGFGEKAADVASLIADPRNEALSPAVKPIMNWVGKGIMKAGSGLLKAVMKIGANVPEKAIEAGSKAGWKVPNATEAEITSSVQAVQGAMKSAVDDAGKLLNEAKSNIGLPTSVAEREASIARYGNPFGIGKADMETGALTQYFKDFTKPEELVAAIKTFKESSKGLPKQLRAKVAAHLQDQTNNFVNWEGKGTVTEGVLKNQYSQLGDFVNESVPKALRERMSKALALKDDLGSMLGEGEGKAQEFLKNLFVSKSAKAKDTLQRLADLEAFTGQPVLQELFKKFAGVELSKVAGRPFMAQTAAISGVAGATTLNPLPSAIGATLFASQSPKVLTRLGRLGAQGSDQVGRAGPALRRATSGFALNEMNKQELERVKNKLKGRK